MLALHAATADPTLQVAGLLATVTADRRGAGCSRYS